MVLMHRFSSVCVGMAGRSFFLLLTILLSLGGIALARTHEAEVGRRLVGHNRRRDGLPVGAVL